MELIFISICVSVLYEKLLVNQLTPLSSSLRAYTGPRGREEIFLTVDCLSLMASVDRWESQVDANLSNDGLSL